MDVNIALSDNLHLVNVNSQKIKTNCSVCNNIIHKTVWLNVFCGGVWFELVLKCFLNVEKDGRPF